MSETIKITDLKPARYNPRKISNEDYNKLSNSINEFGLVDPIIINLNNNTIIGGHQRYEVLMDEYMAGDEDYSELQIIKRGDIGWVFPNEQLKIKDLNHEKALNLVLNKVQGEWELDKLEDLFNDLTIEGLDLQITGFEKDEIKNMFKNVDVSTFGEGLEDNYLGEEEEEDKKDSRTSKGKPIKHYECPSCGYEWSDEDIENDDV
ncbi:ParB N-terminal domain-containing protein [Methanobrevibacter sp.]|uniref:ParB N-terminal domain-containing protein n=1 Tax=Methanobrevibacter sp. TaxID=66852 RepID=UPI00386E6059